MNSPDKADSVSAAPPVRARISEETRGFVYSLLSAVCYSISLTSIRGMTNFPEVSSDWTIAMKEALTVVCVAPFMIVQIYRGRMPIPRLKPVLLLIAAGASCQIVGARPHLLAYAAIGLALATPLIQAFQLIVTSIIGAIFLGERVSKIKAIAIATLVVAVCLLGFGQTGDGLIAGKAPRVGLGVLLVLCTAIGYATQMTLMRFVLRDAPASGDPNAPAEPKTPNSVAMITVCGVGFVVCSVCLLIDRGAAAFISPPPICWAYVLTSGVANLIGFILQIESVRRLHISKATLIAASQLVVLSMIGFLFFHEPITATSFVGLILAALGIAISGFSK